MLDVSRDDIVDGSLSKALVLVSIPLVAQGLTRVVEQLVDTFWLGRLGENAVAAVGLNFPIVAVLLILTGEAARVGTQVLVSQRVGGGDESAARQIAFHGATLALVLGVVFGALFALGARPLLSLFDPGPEVVRLGAIYLSIYAIRAPFSAVADTLEGAFVGWGDARAAFLINLVPVAVNFVLDPLLIFGVGPVPGLGIAGAALATTLSSVAGVAVALAFALGAWYEFGLDRDAVGFQPGEYRKLVDVGAPVAGQHLAGQSVRVLVVGVVSVVGGAAGLAAYNVGGRVASLAIVYAGGIQDATRSVVGQNLGADRPDRARRATWLGVALAVVGTVLVGAGQFLVPTAVATAIAPDLGPDGLALTVDYLRILAVGYWGLGAGYIFLGGFDGAQHTRISMVADLLKYWAVRLPVALVGAYALGMGVHAVFWAVTVSNVVAALGAGAYYGYSARDGMLERAAEAASAD